MEPPPLPRDLRLVALLFLFCGICAVIDMIASAAHNNVNLDFGFLGIPAYFGLHRLSNGWRFYAMFCSWLCILFSPVLALLSFSAPYATINILGIPGPAVPSFVMIGPCFFWMALAIWQLKVLTRPDVVELFTVASISRF